MSSVGAYLRGLRQKQGMSIDELSRATRVLHHYLEALETDNIGSLPAPVFTKGFIRAYCQAIGVAAEEALRLYDRIGVPAPNVAKVPVGAVRAAVSEIQRRQIVHEPDYLPTTPPGPSPQGEPRDKRARGTLLVSFILLLVLGVAFFAVTLVLQSGRQGDDEPSARVALPPFPGAADAPAESPVPASAPAAAPAESPVPQPAGVNQLAKQSSGAAPSASVTPSAPAPGASPTPGARATASAPAMPIAPAAPRVAAAPRSSAPPAADRADDRHRPEPGNCGAGCAGASGRVVRARHRAPERARAGLAVSAHRTNDRDDVDACPDRGRPDQRGNDPRE